MKQFEQSIVSKNSSWVARQIIYADVLDILHTSFFKNRIKYLPIKGAFLIQCKLAGRLKNRKMVDIDILVNPEDFHRASNALLNIPETIEKPNIWSFERSFFIPVAEGWVCVELHTQLNYPERFLIKTQNLFERAKHQNGSEYALDPVDALCILVCHALVHVPFEISETLADEIALISTLSGFSWQEFWNRIRKAGIYKFACFVVLLYEKIKNADACIPSKARHSIFLAWMYQR